MIIAIDGACKNNGSEDCISAGSAFLKMSSGYTTVDTKVEAQSTNQRGELIGFIAGLGLGSVFLNKERNVHFVTDSEYIYNAVTKDWPETWIKRGWVTANGDPVKNKDLWTIAYDLLKEFDENSFSIFHVKGHIMPFGRVTATNLINADSSGKLLYEEAKVKLEQLNTNAAAANPKNTTHRNFNSALDTFYKNHGYCPPMSTFSEFVVCNTVADIFAANALAVHLAI